MRYITKTTVIVLFVFTLLACQSTSVPPGGADSQILRRIAFSSCAADWVEQPIWETIAAANPDLYISLGDAVYADYDGRTRIEVSPRSLREKWQTLESKPEFAIFRRTVPIVATWDNHDYGTYDGGQSFALKEESKSIFLDFWDEPPNSERRKRAGIYTSYLYGPAGRRVQIIVLDTRSFKSDAKKDVRSAATKASLSILGRYRPIPPLFLSPSTINTTNVWPRLNQCFRRVSTQRPKGI